VLCGRAMVGWPHRVLLTFTPPQGRCLVEMFSPLASFLQELEALKVSPVTRVTASVSPRRLPARLEMKLGLFVHVCGVCVWCWR
jgi:hypothetical protein